MTKNNCLTETAVESLSALIKKWYVCMDDYADLINHNNSRCMEAVRRIRDERLAYSE